VRLYRDALALIYVPFDEDYGLATLEAFLAEKPVITAQDSGGTLEFVRDGINGFVTEPDAAAIAGAAARLAADHTLARSMGRAGRELALSISWDHVIERLISHG
jgi:glycosyltransferase involved in cell wall biosynthesis